MRLLKAAVPMDTSSKDPASLGFPPLGPRSFVRAFLHPFSSSFDFLLALCEFNPTRLDTATRGSRWRPWLRKAFPLHFMVSRSTRNGSF